METILLICQIIMECPQNNIDTEGRSVYRYLNTQLEILSNQIHQYFTWLKNVSFVFIKARPAQAKVQILTTSSCIVKSIL